MTDATPRAGARTLPPELDPRRARTVLPGGSSAGSSAGSSGGPGGRGRRVLAWVSGTMAALVVLTSVAGYLLLGHYEGRIDRVDVFGGLVNRPAKVTDTAQNYLLVGSDNREGLSAAEARDLHVGTASAANGGGRRSDTMILLHISEQRDKATLVSLPRDSYVRIPAYTDDRGVSHSPSHNKLNAAYALGGPALAVATVEENTGVRVDHYVEVGFEGFVRMVDAVGGVQVCTPKAIEDSKSGLSMQAGTNDLDGGEALAYVRARYFDPRADIGRIERQQKFLGALFRQATSAEVLLNPVKMNAFLDAVLGSVQTDPDLTRGDIVDLVTKTRGLAPSSVVFATVPISDMDYRPGGVGSTVRWDETQASSLFESLRRDEAVGSQATTSTKASGPVVTVAPSAITVQVLNGAGVQGLGARAADDLARVGFVMAGPAKNADRTGATVTEVRYDPRWDQSLKTLLAALPGAKAVAVKGQGKVFQVLVGSSYSGATKVTVKASAAPSASHALTTTSAAESVCG